MKTQNSEDTENMAPPNSPGHSVGAILKLQCRKEQLEKAIREKCLELKTLCLKEFELTGMVPRETPFEANESPPKNRRKILTMYPYNSEFLKHLAEEVPQEEPLKRKALNSWSSSDNLPRKIASPDSFKLRTWTSPKQEDNSSGRFRSRSHLPKTLKFLKKLHQ